jgi:heme-degrading monooxygenase HmoA
MIARVWHGWASNANAQAYEKHFRTDVLRHLRQVDGFRGAQLWRREDGGEIEFVAVTNFESIDAVGAFAGSDSELAVVEPEARGVLLRFDARCKHYEVVVSSVGVEDSGRSE